MPQRAAVVLCELKWTLAVKEALAADDDEMLDYIDRQFLKLSGLARKEQETARRYEAYRLMHTDFCFCSKFNDTALFKALGLLYMARLFKQKENRDAFLGESRGAIKEEDLMALVDAGDLGTLSLPFSASVDATLEQILDSKFCTDEPNRYENESLSPTLKFLGEQISKAPATRAEACVRTHFKELESAIVCAYHMENLGPRRDMTAMETYSDDQLFKPLTNDDLECLLRAARRNEFFDDLISSKPPNCACISHEQALLECGEHARLWLLDAKVPVYYNFLLRYCDMAKTDRMTNVEKEAWDSNVGFRAEILSTVEKTIRRQTIVCYSEPGSGMEAPDIVKFLSTGDADADEKDWYLALLKGYDPLAKIAAVNSYVEKQQAEKPKKLKKREEDKVGPSKKRSKEKAAPPQKEARPTRKSPRLQARISTRD